MASAAATANPLGAAASEDRGLSDMVPYCRVEVAVGFVVRTLRRLKSNMPYGQELQETLQVARQQLKAVADNRECEGLPPKQWSRCNRQDLVEICVWARKKSRFWYCLQEDIRYMWGVVAACPHWFLRCRCDNVSPVAT